METLEQRRILVYPVTKCLNGHHDRYQRTKARYLENFTFRDTICKLIYNLYTSLEHPRGDKTVNFRNQSESKDGLRALVGYVTRSRDTWRRTIERELKENGLETWAPAASAAEDRTAYRQRAYGPILHLENGLL